MLFFVYFILQENAMTFSSYDMYRALFKQFTSYFEKRVILQVILVNLAAHKDII